MVSHRWSHLAVLSALVFLGGCAFTDHRTDLARLHANGRYEAVAATLDDPEIMEAYGARNRTLWEMERGAVALALDDPDNAIEHLNLAEARIDARREDNAGDVFAKWVINDPTAVYRPAAYEDAYLNVLKMLAQFEAGRILGGATVEARRMAIKADLLRDEYLRYRDDLDETNGKDADLYRARQFVPETEEGQFIESPLGAYLSAIAFAKSGSRDMQQVAGRRLNEAIEAQRELFPEVQTEPFADIGERSADTFNALIVAMSGRGPTKVADSFGPILIATVPIYFELPRVTPNDSTVRAVRVEVDGIGTTSLDLIEDFGVVAEENFKRMRPAIYTRTLMRASAKAAGASVATHAVRNSGSDTAWLSVLTQVGGLLAIWATEQADLRTWVMLPGRAYVGLLSLPAGEHRVRVVYSGTDGFVVRETEWVTITVGEGPRNLKTVVTHDWR